MILGSTPQPAQPHEQPHLEEPPVQPPGNDPDKRPDAQLPAHKARPSQVTVAMLDAEPLMFGLSEAVKKNPVSLVWAKNLFKAPDKTTPATENQIVVNAQLPSGEEVRYLVERDEAQTYIANVAPQAPPKDWHIALGKIKEIKSCTPSFNPGPAKGLSRRLLTRAERIPSIKKEQ